MLKTKTIKIQTSLSPTRQAIMLAIAVLENTIDTERALRTLAAYYGYKIERL